MENGFFDSKFTVVVDVTFRETTVTDALLPLHSEYELVRTGVPVTWNPSHPDTPGITYDVPPHSNCGIRRGAEKVLFWTPPNI
jgi:hypothetical protein